VSRVDFWEAIRSNEPVSRPVETEEAPVEHDARVIAVLVLAGRPVLGGRFLTSGRSPPL
jgi:hypothetical protein